MADNMNMQISFFALGTMNTIKVYQCSSQKILERVFNCVNEIDDMMSVYKTSSDIYRLNKSAGHGPVGIHGDTLELLEKARYYSEMAAGKFDITVGPMTRLWGIGKKLNYIPDHEEIMEKLELVNYQDIRIDKEYNQAALLKEGQCVDLGGIAKGFAADEVTRILKEGGVRNALINLGGNIVALGTREDGTPWNIGVQNPVMPRGHYIGTLDVVNKTVVTSGVYERFFMKNEICYHHIIDPKTGYPAETELLGVTVIADNSIDADALTTALFVVGAEEGMRLLAKLELDVDVIFITNKMRIIMTESFITKFNWKESRLSREKA